ncbi:phosphotransferase family protein [Trujillonella endophytica]|uniref:Phosphotransferase enzyme family protein n=1 Tax=Trujillonella endophytica TaxID=673521 RepID=A0A1H8V4X6_9ACTN|nr:phosphotransferase [Trujillella endophytica]SEP10446.1 Phosphotransferase enzyme family protein [Trujillella endophytica]
MLIPADWADLSPEWMTAALAQSCPGAQVAGLTLLRRSDGTNRRATFGLTYAAGSGPDVVFVKSEGEHRDAHARNGNLWNEPAFYSSGRPIPVDHPRPYAVLVDRPALDWVVVLEDVTGRGGDPRDALRPMTVDQVAAGARGLGALHRQYRGFRQADVPALEWVQTWAPTEGFSSGLRRRVPLGLERAGDRLPAEVLRCSPDEVVDLWVRYVALLHRDPTLLHADAHVGNTYVLPGDDVGFLDWQVVRRGHWSQDVGYFVQGALTDTDRRAAEQDLVEAHRTALDPAADRDEAWLWYRASAAYGLAIWLSTLGTDGYQSHDISLELAIRYATAFVELETRAALTSLE